MESQFLLEIVRFQKQGIPKGVYSVCSANRYVIEAAMEKALRDDSYFLLEATSNQVNQFGGYTGMKPSVFRDFVFSIAERLHFPLERVVLGADHLGPNPWKDQNANQAMGRASEMIREYVMAGFTKIHLDASMRLADDREDKKHRLSPEIVAERTAQLCSVSENTFRELRNIKESATPPVYVIGSEVPAPGGLQDSNEGFEITEPSDFRENVTLTKEAFRRHGLEEAWQRVIAVVVQPGVEFGDNVIHDYNREKAKELCEALREFPNLVFEGHSTDYQTASALRQMVEDGIAILKVGPALTFAMREAVFLLHYIERELLRETGMPLSDLPQVLDRVMVENPKYWQGYYKGDDKNAKFWRKYSLCDRSRYYWGLSEVTDSLNLLIKNLKENKIPMTLLSQFFPQQYRKIRSGALKVDPETLIKDRIGEVLEDYSYAVTLGSLNPKRT